MTTRQPQLVFLLINSFLVKDDFKKPLLKEESGGYFK